MGRAGRATVSIRAASCAVGWDQWVFASRSAQGSESNPRSVAKRPGQTGPCAGRASQAEQQSARGSRPAAVPLDVCSRCGSGLLEFAEVAARPRGGNRGGLLIRPIAPGWGWPVSHGVTCSARPLARVSTRAAPSCGASQYSSSRVSSRCCVHAARPGKGRVEVIEDHGPGHAFGLGTLTGIVDDEGVEMGSGPAPIGKRVVESPSLAGSHSRLPACPHAPPAAGWPPAAIRDRGPGGVGVVGGLESDS